MLLLGLLLLLLLLLVFWVAKDGMCLVLLLQLRRKPIWHMYVWDAYLASILLRRLFEKRLRGMLGWQVHHWEAYLAGSWLESLFGKCIVGKPMPDAVAVPKAQKDTKDNQKSLQQYQFWMPKYQFWKPKCLKIASWSSIFFPSRFWIQNGTTIRLPSNIFWWFWVLQGVPKTAKNQ